MLSIPTASAADLEIRIATESISSGTFLRYVLHSPSGKVAFTHAVIEGGTRIRTDPVEYQQRMLGHLAELGAGRRSDGSRLVSAREVARELDALGHELYKELFPKELRFAYREFRERVTTLHLISDEPWIPWELVKPYESDFDDDFLCCQFELTRWLAGDSAPSPGPGALELGVARVVVIEAGSPPGAPALPAAGAESHVVQEFAAGYSGVESVLLRSPTFNQVEELLRRGGSGVLHFVGHSEARVDDPNVARFKLGDGSALRPRDLHGAIESRLRRDRPLMVFNSCQSAQQGVTLSRLGGWVARSIVDCGCGAFLGPQWNVRDDAAILFIRTFYKALGAGETLGQAVLKARRIVRCEIPESTDWLAYSLYAHPAAFLRLGLGPVPLEIPKTSWKSQLSPPGALLRAEYGVVPFHLRKVELAESLTWCHGDAPVGVRLLTGAGGMGKTRLALELCQSLGEEGWQTGLFAPDPARAPEKVWRDLTIRNRPTLVVIDYAETRRDLLVPLLRQMVHFEKGKIRLLLLARAALDWWEQLKYEGEGVGELLTGPATRWHTLQPLALSPADREASYRTAAEAFAERLQRPVPGMPEGLEGAPYERVLLLHMKALAHVEGVVVKDEDGMLDYVLRRERRFWARLADELQLSEAIVQGIGRAMAAITLGGGTESESNTVNVLAALRFFEGAERSVLVQVARLLHRSYPGNRWVEPVLPDLLGEHLIMREMEQGADELLDLVLGPRTG